MGEAGAVERIEVDVEAAEAGAVEIFGVIGEEDGVGGEGDVFDAGDGGELFDENRKIFADEGFAAGDAEFADAERDRDAGKAGDFLKRQDLFARHELHAVFGHAVEAADVAAVGDADAQVVVQAGESVDEGCFGHLLHGEHAFNGQAGALHELGAEFDAGGEGVETVAELF